MHFSFQRLSAGAGMGVEVEGRGEGLAGKKGGLGRKRSVFKAELKVPIQVGVRLDTFFFLGSAVSMSRE